MLGEEGVADLESWIAEKVKAAPPLGEGQLEEIKKLLS